MNKKELSERDICTKFITPALAVGNKWDLMSQIREEVYFTKGRVLFLKIFDAQETELEMTRDDYRSPFPQKLRWRNWAADAEGITGEALMKFINDDLFPGLKGSCKNNFRHFGVMRTF